VYTCCTCLYLHTHLLLLLMYVVCIMFKCCVVCKFNMIWYDDNVRYRRTKPTATSGDCMFEQSRRRYREWRLNNRRTGHQRWLTVNRLTVNPLISILKPVNHRATDHHIAIQWWYTGIWWVGCYIWYSDERPGRGLSPPSPSLLYQM